MTIAYSYGNGHAWFMRRRRGAKDGTDVRKKFAIGSIFIIPTGQLTLRFT